MLSSICKASAVIELKFFSKNDVWSGIISFFLAVLGIYSIWQKFSYISLIYRKYPFIMELILMKNINKTPKKISMMMEISKWDNEKFAFKKWLSNRFDFL